MVPLLLVLGVFGTLIAFGVCVSLHLYHGGAIGNSRYGRSRRLSLQNTLEDSREAHYYIGVDEMEDATSRIARNSLVVLVAGLVVFAIVATSFVGTLIH